MSEDKIKAPTLGELIDSRGITVTLGDGDFITDIVLLAEVVNIDGETSKRDIVISRDGTTNWLKEIGMIEKAVRVLNP